MLQLHVGKAVLDRFCQRNGAWRWFNPGVSKTAATTTTRFLVVALFILTTNNFCATLETDFGCRSDTLSIVPFPIKASNLNDQLPYKICFVFCARK